MKQAAIFKYLHLITVCKYSVGARTSESCLYAPISYLGCIEDNAKHLWLNGFLPAIKRRWFGGYSNERVRQRRTYTYSVFVCFLVYNYTLASLNRRVRWVFYLSFIKVNPLSGEYVFTKVWMCDVCIVCRILCMKGKSNVNKYVWNVPSCHSVV